MSEKTGIGERAMSTEKVQKGLSTVMEGESEGESEREMSTAKPTLSGEGDSEGDSETRMESCSFCYLPLEPASVFTCGDCMKRPYCSLICQKGDWTHHRIWCGRGVAELDVDVLLGGCSTAYVEILSGLRRAGSWEQERACTDQQASQAVYEP
jgi:hypothetical protein